MPSTEIIDELREKCPWDKEQTLETLRKLTIEETYELADAILQNDLQMIKKELGDCKHKIRVLENSLNEQENRLALETKKSSQFASEGEMG